MKTISTKMYYLLERLAEMFPSSSYESKLKSYLIDKSITDPVQLEHYINKFEKLQGTHI